jgi:hypothetical protein
MSPDADRPAHEQEPAGEEVHPGQGDLGADGSPNPVGSVMQLTTNPRGTGELAVPPSRPVASVRGYLHGLEPPDTPPALATRMRHGIDIALNSYQSTPAERLDAIDEVLRAGLGYVAQLAERLDREIDR